MVLRQAESYLQFDCLCDNFARFLARVADETPRDKSARAGVFRHEPFLHCGVPRKTLLFNQVACEMRDAAVSRRISRNAIGAFRMDLRDGWVSG
jgi:hypothetical protein